MNGSFARTAGLQSPCLMACNSEWIALHQCCDDFQIAVEGDAEKR